MGVHVKSVHEGNVEGQINAPILVLGFLHNYSIGWWTSKSILYFPGPTLPLAVFYGVLLNLKP